MQQKSTLRMLKLWMVLSMLINTLQHINRVNASEDVINVTPCELESIINHLINPSLQYPMHVSALRNQLKHLINGRQLAVGEEQDLENADPYALDKRSVAALAAQGLLRGSALKRGLATLAKNGQLPTQDPDLLDKLMTRNENKRFLGSVMREGKQIYNKRNIGTLARDFQLPNGKRNVASLRRFALFSAHPKRNLAAIARYNSMHMTGVENGNNNDLDPIDGTPSLDVDEESPEKRSIAALKGSPVHGIQQKRLQSDDDFLPMAAVGDLDYAEASAPNDYWWYPNYAGYADLDWGYRRAQKRFLGRVLPPTRATASTHRGRK